MKKTILKSLFDAVYFKDIMELNSLRKEEFLDELCNIILHFENIFYIMQNRMDSYFTNRIPKTTDFFVEFAKW